jgi:large subunit ribosomal protein L25
VIKAIQHNPVTEQLLHIDFQHIHKKEKIRATIPIHFAGEAPGVKEGGVMDIHLHEIVVRCLPDDMPSHIAVEISNLKLGDTIHLRDLKLPNVDFELTPETSVISVLIPKKVEEVAKPVVVEEAAAVSEESAEIEE